MVRRLCETGRFQAGIGLQKVNTAYLRHERYIEIGTVSLSARYIGLSFSHCTAKWFFPLCCHFLH